MIFGPGAAQMQPPGGDRLVREGPHRLHQVKCVEDLCGVWVRACQVVGRWRRAPCWAVTRGLNVSSTESIRAIENCQQIPATGQQVSLHFIA